MKKYNVVGSSVADLSVLASVLENIALLGQTELYDTVEISQDNAVLTLYKGTKKLFSWENGVSYATFKIYTGSAEDSAVTISNDSRKCPTFLLDLNGIIYIGRSTTNAADLHISWLAIAPSNSGETTFLVHTGTSSGNLGQNIYCIAYGDQQTPAQSISWTPSTSKNCAVYYPIPTNCTVSSANWADGCYALAFTQYAVSTIGTVDIGEKSYYSNGYAIFEDKDAE